MQQTSAHGAAGSQPARRPYASSAVKTLKAMINPSAAAGTVQSKNATSAICRDNINYVQVTAVTIMILGTPGTPTPAA